MPGPDPVDIKDLKIGQTVCDMHGRSLFDLENGVLPSNWEIRESVRLPYGSAEFIQEMIRKHNPSYTYINKELVVIGENWDGSLVCACSFDGLFSRFVEIEVS